jgi:hypothetical protein
MKGTQLIVGAMRNFVLDAFSKNMDAGVFIPRILLIAFNSSLLSIIEKVLISN